MLCVETGRPSTGPVEQREIIVQVHGQESGTVIECVGLCLRTGGVALATRTTDRLVHNSKTLSQLNGAPACARRMVRA